MRRCKRGPTMCRALLVVGQKQATIWPIIAPRLRVRHTMIETTMPMKTVAKVIAVARNASAGM